MGGAHPLLPPIEAKSQKRHPAAKAGEHPPRIEQKCILERGGTKWVPGAQQEGAHAQRYATTNEGKLFWMITDKCSHFILSIRNSENFNMDVLDQSFVMHAAFGK